jgi:hypothetical protein
MRLVVLGRISKSFVAALGAFLGAVIFFVWTITPLGAQGKLFALRRDHSALVAEHKVTVDRLKTRTAERDRAVAETWKWSAAYKALDGRLKAETQKSLQAASERARRQADNSFEAGLLACEAKGAQDGTNQDDGPDGHGRSAPGLRAYWKRSAYPGYGEGSGRSPGL